MFPSIFIKRRDDLLLPFLRMFCDHKKAEVVYREKGYKDNVGHTRIFYCPDCHKYGYIPKGWTKKLCDVSNFVYVGEEK